MLNFDRLFKLPKPELTGLKKLQFQSCHGKFVINWFGQTTVADRNAHYEEY